MTIFGISLLDNFGFEFIRNFIIEIKVISSNIIDYLSNTHFYNYLSKIFNNKEIIENKDIKIMKNKDIIKDIPNKTVDISNKSSDSWNSDYYRKEDSRYEPWDKGIYRRKVSDWFKDDKYENINPVNNESNNYKYYFYLGTIIIVASVSWYYSDEIKTAYASLIEWIFSFRPGPSDNPGSGSNNSSTHIGSNIQKPVVEIVQVAPKSSPSPVSVELEDMKTDIDKGKSIMTSPSLEDLSEQVKDSWGEGSNSPGSDTSIETITQKTFYSTESYADEFKEIIANKFAWST